MRAKKGKRMIGLKGIAENLGVSIRTARRLRSAGKLPAPLTISRRCLRWRWEDVFRALGGEGVPA